MRLIGLTGPAGCGKDTVGEILRDHGFLVYSFAHPLRLMLEPMLNHLGITGFYNDREWKERAIDAIGKSPRQLLQTLGTEWGRNLIHPDIWVTCMDRFTRATRDLYDMVITDVRFENEAAWIRNQGGQIWHIYRDTAPVSAHSSENGIELHPSDYPLNNTGTLDALRLTVGDMLNVTRAPA